MLIDHDHPPGRFDAGHCWACAHQAGLLDHYDRAQDQETNLRQDREWAWAAPPVRHLGAGILRRRGPAGRGRPPHPMSRLPRGLATRRELTCPLGVHPAADTELSASGRRRQRLRFVPSSRVQRPRPARSRRQASEGKGGGGHGRHHHPRTHQALRRGRRRRRPQLRGRPGHGGRLPGPQRGRQDHHPAHPCWGWSPRPAGRPGSTAGPTGRPPPPRPACAPWPPQPASGCCARRAHPRHHRPGGRLAARPASPLPGRSIVAATVRCAWSHAGRCHTDAALPCWAGHTHPAASGQTVPVRLNRSGGRHPNRALHLVVLTRLDPATPPLPNDAAPRARPTAKSNAAWSATSPASTTGSSSTPPP